MAKMMRAKKAYTEVAPPWADLMEPTGGAQASDKCVLCGKPIVGDDAAYVSVRPRAVGAPSKYNGGAGQKLAADGHWYYPAFEVRKHFMVRH